MNFRTVQRFTRSNRKGFTLIELLVVIAIIGVLAAVVLVSLNTARMRGRDARRLADLDSVRLAIEVWSDQNGSVYPDAASGDAGTSNAVYGEVTSALVTADLLTAAPADPVAGRLYVAGVNTETLATSYILGADLEADHTVCDTDYDGADLAPAMPATVCDEDGGAGVCAGDDANDDIDFCICQGTGC